MQKRVLCKAICAAMCAVTLSVGAIGHTGRMQAVSGQVASTVNESGSYTQVIQKSASVKSKKSTSSGWTEDKKYYYLEDGKMATGIVLIKGKFYSFEDDGKYNKSITKKIQKAATYEQPFSKLKKYIGKPKKSQYLSSCYGKGKDGILTYKNFKVYTFRPDKGVEIFMGAE